MAKHAFFGIHVTRDRQETLAGTTIAETAQTAVNLISGTPFTDMSFNYEQGVLTKNQKKKLKALLAIPDPDVTVSILSRYLSLLYDIERKYQ